LPRCPTRPVPAMPVLRGMCMDSYAFQKDVEHGQRWVCRGALIPDMSSTPAAFNDHI
jgi:hypothetical protein